MKSGPSRYEILFYKERDPLWRAVWVLGIMTDVAQKENQLVRFKPGAGIGGTWPDPMANAPGEFGPTRY